MSWVSVSHLGNSSYSVYSSRVSDSQMAGLTGAQWILSALSDDLGNDMVVCVAVKDVNSMSIFTEVEDEANDCWNCSYFLLSCERFTRTLCQPDVLAQWYYIFYISIIYFGILKVIKKTDYSQISVTKKWIPTRNLLNVLRTVGNSFSRLFFPSHFQVQVAGIICDYALPTPDFHELKKNFQLFFESLISIPIYIKCQVNIPCYQPSLLPTHF